jgi:arylsulfatase A-like enzyme/Flp pilus assembly protein TadD
VRREAGLNVLLITIDTLRADAVGAYGQPGGITPWMDRLAGGGLRFTHARAHNVITLPSHANILSGRLPPDHGVRDNSGFRFPPGTETLATLLKARGYRTGAFVSAFPLDSRFGLGRGFDVYDDRFADAARPAFLIQERAASATIANARLWVDAQGDQPWFAWVHLYEPHFPYAPPEPFASRFPQSPYHGEVSTVDAALAPLLAPILSAGDQGRTLVVLTSDHGESLGDHGEATHGVFAYEAGLRVPLLIYQPRLFAPAVAGAPAGHVDVLPTVLDAIEAPVPDGIAGRSLLPPAGRAAGADATARPTYFEAMSASLTRRWAPLDGVVQREMKYVDLPIPELYDLAADPREERNLAASQPARLEELRALLRGIARRTPIALGAETPETRDRLRSLGYAAGGGSAPPRFTERDDPKNLIAIDTLLQEVVGLYVAGDLRGALARCRELVQQRPGMPLSLLQLAHLEREAGDLPAAVDALRKAVALAPENAEAAALLGAYLTQAGRAEEAVKVLEPYARRAPADVEILTSQALALARLGRPREALAALSLARDQDPSNARLLLETGTVQLMAGNRPAARQAFTAALELNPSLARAHSSLGVLYIEDGRIPDAIGQWKAATALDPREFDTVLAVGLSLARDGRTAPAQAVLEFFAASAPPARYAAEIDRVRRILRNP